MKESGDTEKETAGHFGTRRAREGDTEEGGSTGDSV